ncbi:MAG: hypothetical protein LBL86_07230 [Coriobacteriales bacterium]|jgi:hypothetical protein|nr:hypothetical protein [Coriobacteriales bacterium]
MGMGRAPAYAPGDAVEVQRRPRGRWEAGVVTRAVPGGWTLLCGSVFRNTTADMMRPLAGRGRGTCERKDGR